MKALAVLDADLENTPLGTRSRLADALAGAPLLRRTVDRLSRCASLQGIVVACPESQRERVVELLDGTPADVIGRDAEPPPYRGLVQVARKWSLDAWRGGLGGSTFLDECVNIDLNAAILDRYPVEALLVAAPGAALLDPALVDAMIAHARAHAGESKLTFAQSPPGLTPVIFQAGLCRQLAEKRVPPGWALAYKPDDPSIDLVFRSCNFPVPQSVRYPAGRLTGDTDRSWRAMNQIVADGADIDAEAVGRWLLAREGADLPPRPREVEIELTTDDPLPDTVLRPRGDRVPSRGPMDPALVESISRELAEDDDALVVLGGCGDPVLHPEFDRILAILRNNRVYGVAVATTGARLTAPVIEALIRHRVDLVAVHVDAWRDETYQRVQGGGDLGRVCDAIAQLEQARVSAAQAAPIIVPHLCKSTLNVEEMDAFFDGWLRARGCAAITGFSHYGRRLDDLTVVDMQPPTRIPCRRLFQRCVVLANGAVSACDQDYCGEIALGHLGDATLTEVWTGSRAGALRAHHLALDLAAEPRCAACCEWHRP